MAINISKSELEQFYELYRDNGGKTIVYKGMRLGQAFHTHFKLEKIKNEEDKIFCDRLYGADCNQSKKMIDSITDYGQ